MRWMKWVVVCIYCHGGGGGEGNVMGILIVGC